MKPFLGDLSAKGNWPAFVFMTAVFTSIGIALDAGTGHVPTLARPPRLDTDCCPGRSGNHRAS